MNEVLRDGRLGGHDPAGLAERFGTPFFVYDLDVVTRQVDALRAVLPPSFDLAYAVKANPSLAVLRHLADRGLGADVASGGELRHVLRAGFDAGSVVLTGPGKRDEELRAAVEAGVRVVTIESRGELRRLASIAGSLGRRQPVLLRAAVDPSGAGDGVGDHAAVGITGKFGMDRDDLRAAAAEAVASPWLDPLGVHAFGASNVTDAAVLAAHVEATVARAVGLAAEAGFDLRLVDAGGGLGIPYRDGEPALDLSELGRRLASLAVRMAASPAARGARVLLEPGRYLVASSGAYVARVVDRKRMGEGTVAIIDGGIHHLLRPVLVGQEQRVVALTGPAGGSRLTPARDGRLLLAGPLCTGLDVFARNAVGAVPDPGDLVAVLDAGAYGATESMPFFLSHPLPAEVAIRGEELWLARPRIEPEAWLDWQVGEPARD